MSSIYKIRTLINRVTKNLLAFAFNNLSVAIFPLIVSTSFSTDVNKNNMGSYNKSVTTSS